VVIRTSRANKTTRLSGYHGSRASSVGARRVDGDATPGYCSPRRAWERVPRWRRKSPGRVHPPRALRLTLPCRLTRCAPTASRPLPLPQAHRFSSASLPESLTVEPRRASGPTEGWHHRQRAVGPGQAPRRCACRCARPLAGALPETITIRHQGKILCYRLDRTDTEPATYRFVRWQGWRQASPYGSWQKIGELHDSQGQAMASMMRIAVSSRGKDEGEKEYRYSVLATRR
jgi:hypothetical protein